MHDITTGKHTVIKDSSGRIVLVIANTLPDVNIGESIPDGTLGWDKNSGTINRYVNGAWSAEVGTLDIDGTLTVGGEAEFLEETHFVSGLHVHGAGDNGGIKWFAGQGDQTTLAHSHEGVISVDLDLAGAASAATVATFIPPRTLVWRAAVEVLVGFTGGTVTKFDVGVTGGDLAGIFNDVALIDAHDFTATVSLAAITGNNTAAGVTVSAKTAGDADATVTTGKVRLTLWLSTIDGPDDAVYA